MRGNAQEEARDSLLFFRQEEEKAAYFGEKFGEEVRNDYAGLGMDQTRDNRRRAFLFTTDVTIYLTCVPSRAR